MLVYRKSFRFVEDREVKYILFAIVGAYLYKVPLQFIVPTVSFFISCQSGFSHSIKENPGAQ